MISNINFLLLAKHRLVIILLSFLLIPFLLNGEQVIKYRNKNQINQQKVTYQYDNWILHKIIGLNPISASGYQYGDKIALFWKAEVHWDCKICGRGVQVLFSKTEYDEDLSLNQNPYVWSAPYIMGSPMVQNTAEAILIILGIPTSFSDLVTSYVNQYFVNNLSQSNILVSVNNLKPKQRITTFVHECQK